MVVVPEGDVWKQASVHLLNLGWLSTEQDTMYIE